MPRSYTAAVVGSGPNGLAAALVLARAGHRVVVHEGHDRPGGGARTEELTLPGFHHDICSAIHPMAVGSPFLATLPLADHGLDWVHPAAPLAHPFDDGSVALLERDVEATGATLGEDHLAWPRRLGPFVRRWPRLAADAMGPLAVPASPLLLAWFGVHALLPATELARCWFRGERARALFGGIAAHSILPLDLPPSSAIGLMLAFAGHAVGWPMPRGGAGAITDALVSLLRQAGGELRLGEPITSLDQVHTDGPILFETAPSALARIAGDALPAGFRARLARYRHGPGVFKVDWALDGPIPWRAPDTARAATVHLGGGLAALCRSERDAWEGRHSDDPYVLLAQHTLFDPSRAPAGKHTAWAYCHVPNGSTVDRTAVIEAQVERFAPGFAERILARHTRDCAGYEAYNPTYVGGDPNVGAPTLDQLFTRPTARMSPYQTPNPRLYLCSAATPPGGGIHGMCGFHAARAALARWRP